ncbi:MAG: metallophosphoesterase [Polyangiaceae bacterium]
MRPQAWSFVLFFAVALTLVGAVHYYIWARLVRDLALPTWTHRGLTALVMLLFASIPLTFWFGRRLNLDAMRPLWLTTFGWLGMVFLLLVLLGTSEIMRALWGLWSRLASDLPPGDPERRVALSRMLGAVVGLGAGGLGAVATHQGLTRLIVKRIAVGLPRFPSALNGFSIVQLTDIHVGPTIRREFIERVVQRTNALQPDLIAITGDLVDGSVEQLREHIAPLARLRAKHGVYFVTGNHEYYSGAERWCEELRSMGIVVLSNSHVRVGDGAAAFVLAGVDDYSSGRFGEGPSLARALAGRDPSLEVVLLAHQPRAAFEASDAGVGLQLSGHTHGGQIWPWSVFVKLQQPVVSGLERIGRTLVYVSNGTGYWGPPMRLGAPAEITRVELSQSST